jgi:hypothetical protein
LLREGRRSGGECAEERDHRDDLRGRILPCHWRSFLHVAVDSFPRSVGWKAPVSARIAIDRPVVLAAQRHAIRQIVAATG